MSGWPVRPHGRERGVHRVPGRRLHRGRRGRDLVFQLRRGKVLTRPQRQLHHLPGGQEVCCKTMLTQSTIFLRVPRCCFLFHCCRLNCLKNKKNETGRSGSRSEACEDCSAGTFAGTDNSATCKACDAGRSTGGLSAATTCTACDRGRYALTRASDCSACSEGFYSAEIAQSSCKACTAGTFARGTLNTNCTSCTAGQYQVWGRESSRWKSAVLPFSFKARRLVALCCESLSSFCLPGRLGPGRLPGL